MTVRAKAVLFKGQPDKYHVAHIRVGYMLSFFISKIYLPAPSRLFVTLVFITFLSQLKLHIFYWHDWHFRLITKLLFVFTKPQRLAGLKK